MHSCCHVVKISMPIPRCSSRLFRLNIRSGWKKPVQWDRRQQYQWRWCALSSTVQSTCLSEISYMQSRKKCRQYRGSSMSFALKTQCVMAFIGQVKWVWDLTARCPIELWGGICKGREKALRVIYLGVFSEQSCKIYFGMLDKTTGPWMQGNRPN